MEIYPLIADAYSVLLPGEDPAEFEVLSRDYHRHLKLDGPVERYFIDLIVQDDWVRRREMASEPRPYRKAPDPAADCALAEVIHRIAYARVLYS